MDKEDILVPVSNRVPFNDTHQVDSAPKYHSFEFVSVNDIPEIKTFLEFKLLRKELMIAFHET